MSSCRYGNRDKKAHGEDNQRDRPLIVVVDDELVTVKRLVRALAKEGRVEGFVSADEALAFIKQEAPDVLISDIRLQDADGVYLMQQVLSMSDEIAVILMTGYASIEQAVEATKKGAFHYLEKPFHISALKKVLRKALVSMQARKQMSLISHELVKNGGFGRMIGLSTPMRQVFNTIAKVAPLDCNVLIQGESGTGKELVARSLHANSPRSSRPFVSFNCGAFSEDLIANELFGHEKGAFTGALTTKVGLLEAANGGTVLLDEVGEMPISMQVKLLRVIQERTFLRVGGIKPIDLDVRFIAATNKDLEKMAAAGDFRYDFFYRLKVVTIELPPLRERREDLMPLMLHFVEKAAKKFGKPVPKLSDGFVEPLESYPFPGNVREMEHIIERAVALSQDDTLRASDLPPDLKLIRPEPVDKRREEGIRPLRSLEKDYIFDVYRKTGFNQSETARILGISRTTLWRRLKKFNLLHKSRAGKS